MLKRVMPLASTSLVAALIVGPVLAAQAGSSSASDAVSLPDATSLLVAPPAPGSPAQLVDADTYLRTRAIRQQDAARWAELRRQTQMTPQAMLESFDGPLGLRLDATTAPALLALWRRTAPEVQRQVAAAQARYRRKRPLLHNHQPICVPRFTRLDRSPSYPSGGAALGWSLALILAEAAPARADAILSHGGSLADSRVACGVNWLSDVQAGERDAGALVAVLHSAVWFRTGLARASRELDAARAAKREH